ncbi:FAD-binding protein [Bosea caraganae]|nr:D-arabinono-1,4-lactone oxidase [Bosea caraganae]
MQNWAGNYAFTAARLDRPSSIDELRRLIAASPRIRAVGTRHSFNGIADTPGVMVDLSGIAPDIVIDRARLTVTVGAGTSYSVLIDRLQQEGLALHNLASLPHISIAGAVATATHGSGDRNQTLASAVAGLELVASDGSVRHVVRGDPDFPAVVVGLGAFGIVSRVTLDVGPSFDIRQDSFVDMPWDDLLGNFDALTSAAYSVSIFTKWSAATAGRIWLKTRLDVPEPEIASLRLRPGPPYAVPATSPDPLARLNPFGVPGPWSERLAHSPPHLPPTPAEQIQSEYLIARPRFAEAVAIIRAMADRVDPVLHVTEIRTMAADELWLSPAYRQDTIGIHFTWKFEAEAVAAVTRELEAALIPLGAKPHWGKLIHADAAALAPLYPRIAEFRACARRYDPDGKFRNAFLDKHVFG